MINVNYSNEQFPIWGYFPLVGFFKEQRFLARNLQQIEAKLNSFQDGRLDVVQVLLFERAHWLQQGQYRSYLSIALCIGCVAINFFPIVFGIAAVLFTIAVLSNKSAIKRCRDFKTIQDGVAAAVSTAVIKKYLVSGL